MYNIALNNPELLGVSGAEAEQAALELQEHLFDTNGVATIGAPMHRSLPHQIATGAADAGFYFLHLAVMAMKVPSIGGQIASMTNIFSCFALIIL